jgi:hypothetical protein
MNATQSQYLEARATDRDLVPVAEIALILDYKRTANNYYTLEFSRAPSTIQTCTAYVLVCRGLEARELP